MIYSENPTKQVQVVVHTFFPGIVSPANEEGISNWHILQNTALFVSDLLVTQYASLKQVTANIQVFKILIGSLKNPSFATELYASGLYASAST